MQGLTDREMKITGNEPASPIVSSEGVISSIGFIDKDNDYDARGLTIRKEYEAVQPDTKITVVARKDGKVDVSKLDPRTGQVAAYELQIMDDGSLHISYRFKS